jgi:demethylmenaquinone methyltransferase/2-methoxy-6-polyprenyl-1,4-benzoquinol methylase
MFPVMSDHRSDGASPPASAIPPIATPGAASAPEGPEARWFGFREVDPNQKASMVRTVFDSVAHNYDLMNDLMSGGLHRLWKNDLIAQLNPPRGEQPFRLLDVAGGTADVTLRYARASGPNATAMLCDISPEMIAVGQRRVTEAGLTQRIDFTEGNAEALPFADGSFDAYTIAFGIRNVTHTDAALREAYRVLKIGGRFLCLEFSEVQVPILDRLYDVHSFEVIPRLGQAIAGEAVPYRYLVESIRKFPNQERFAAMVRDAGFARVSYRNLTGGVAAIHSGWKI